MGMTYRGRSRADVIEIQRLRKLNAKLLEALHPADIRAVIESIHVSPGRLREYRYDSYTQICSKLSHIAFLHVNIIAEAEKENSK